jgi:hypothetical protein
MFGFISSRKNLKCSKFSTIFRILLNDNSIRKSFSCNRIGGEYEKLNSFFQKLGIEHHVSCPHAHQQNGYMPAKKPKKKKVDGKAAAKPLGKVLQKKG